MTDYLPNGGQTYTPVQENIQVPFLPFSPLSRPDPALPALELSEDFARRGFVLTSQAQHYLPGVAPEMLDWWWANMEKGYYLWAPGSHKRFSWVRSPGAYGFLHSAHRISETLAPGRLPFGGDGIQVDRLDLSWYPFTTCLERVIVEGIFTESGEFFDSTIHMWEAAPGGSYHITASVANSRCSRPPAFVLAMAAQAPAEGNEATMADHAEYEASRWPEFLPTLYRLWEGHPDLSQNVACDLRVRRTASGWAYLAENGPVRV